MADEPKDGQKQPEGGDESPKRRRSSGTRKAAAKKPPARGAGETKQPPRRRAPARAKEGAGAAKAEKKPASKPEAQAEAPAEVKAPEPETKPARRRTSRPAAGRREPAKTPTRPVVTARARYVRSSARKARLVLDHVRGKSVADARAVLRHSPRGIARDLERLLNSAVANAENNHDLVGDDLFVKEVFADEGPTLKRFRARAQGRAYRVRKRTSHLTMMLTPRG
jgi:ribosomal protein L22